MRPLLIRATGFLALLICAALVAASCDAPGGKSLNDETEPVNRDVGRQVFQTSCRACHALADADAVGVFGPDLDTLQPDAERVREQIESGGGGMPANILEGEDADLVARYVAEGAGRGPEPEEQASTRGGTKGRANG